MKRDQPSTPSEQPLVRLRRLLGEQWSPQWVPNEAIDRACDEIERLRRAPVSERGRWKPVAWMHKDGRLMTHGQLLTSPSAVRDSWMEATPLFERNST